MTVGAHKNLAVSTVAVAPASNTDTTLTVSTGQGVRFPAPPFSATVWPYGVLADPANAEIVLVEAAAGDTWTIARAQEGTTARTILVGDAVAATLTAATINDLETAAATHAAWADDQVILALMGA